MELPKKKKSSTICPATSTSGTNSKNPRLQANPTKKSTIPAVFSNNSSSPSSSSTTMQPVKHFTGLFGTRSKPESSPEPAASSSSSAEIPPEPVEENPDSEGVSLFQGDNRIFPSRQSAANLEQQQAVETGEVSNPVNSPALPANVTRNPANERRDEEVHVVNVAANRESLASSRGQSEDRMGDDGYPLVLGEYGPSDRQNALEKQRSIDDVIQQQMFVVADGIFRNNAEVAEMDDMARIFDELGEMLNDDTGASASRNERLHPQLAAAEEQQQLQQVSEFEGVINDARSGRPGPSGLSKQRLRLPEQQTSRPDQASFSSSTKAVNILPASRSLMEHPPSNLIAFGVRPRNPPTSSASSSSTSDFQKRVQRRRPANVEENSPLGWQAAKSSLKERVNYMYCNDFLADVYFLVGKSDNKQRIAAHKFVLSIGSVVFDAMFNGGLTPQNSRDPLEIELPDVEPSAFLTLLKFLYSDEVNIGPESVMTTLYTAKKYAVPAMETACVEFLKQSLEAENAFMLLTQARLFDEPQLEQLCLELIDKNTTDALAGDGFCEIDLDTLCAVLRRDSLRVREAPLFQVPMPSSWIGKRNWVVARVEHLTLWTIDKLPTKCAAFEFLKLWSSEACKFDLQRV
ncbi:unnamed protein product [Caenorhabditis auriculariae]|uniref:BTB domain-containing protein n=1 Tax=Caenorhabditis auriculariae TaxID=2777116 RepID=A0A8S1HBL1_9PELO|nr:unnamed protein product [Caenorhabditis auriculariae]